MTDNELSNILTISSIMEEISIKWHNDPDIYLEYTLSEYLYDKYGIDNNDEYVFPQLVDEKKYLMAVLKFKK